jgi:hypothetical protein
MATRFPGGIIANIIGNLTGNVTGNLTGSQTGGTSDIQGTVITAIDLTNDVTLTAAQAKATRLEVTTGSASKVIIVPTGLPGKVYVVANAHATLAAGIKVAGGTAVSVAATKTAIVQVNGAGTEVKRLTADV